MLDKPVGGEDYGDVTLALDDDYRILAHEPCTGEISNLVRHHRNIELPVVNSHSLSLDVGHEAHVLHPVSLVQHQVLEVEEGDLALVSIVHGSETKYYKT